MNESIRLQAKGVRVQFGATVALDGVDLLAKAGEIHALIGENGAGKSTLMKVLSGAMQPQAGEMEIDARPYRPKNPLDARLAGVAMIYQELSLAPDLTVAENIFLGREPGGLLMDRSAMRAKTRAVLKRVGREDIDPEGLERLENHFTFRPCGRTRALELVASVKQEAGRLAMRSLTFDGRLEAGIAAHHLDLGRRPRQIFRVRLELRMGVGEVQQR